MSLTICRFPFPRGDTFARPILPYTAGSNIFLTPEVPDQPWINYFQLWISEWTFFSRASLADENRWGHIRIYAMDSREHWGIPRVEDFRLKITLWTLEFLLLSYLLSNYLKLFNKPIEMQILSILFLSSQFYY